MDTITITNTEETGDREEKILIGGKITEEIFPIEEIEMAIFLTGGKETTEITETIEMTEVKDFKEIVVSEKKQAMEGEKDLFQSQFQGRFQGQDQDQDQNQYHKNNLLGFLLF